jgi:predicted transcriptional regulator
MDGRIHLRRIDLDDLIAAFRAEQHAPDERPLEAVVGTVIANRMEEGDPVWMTVVAGSSRGKTELVTPLDVLPEVFVTGKLTEASLLSGTSKRERAANAKGGLLREIGESGTLVVKDLGAILTLHRDSRAEVLQALREVYDGLYTRDVGTDGGKRLRWEGRLGLIAAGTTALDSAHAVVSALGERWLTIRLPETGRDEIARMALGRSGTAEMRARLREAFSSFIEHIDVPALVPLEATEEDLIVAISNLTTLARSAVDRDSYTREIVLVHDSEGPARIARQLHKLTCALRAMGMELPSIRDLLVKIGYDSIPSPRREVLIHLLETNETARTAEIATGIDLPTRSVERACEELTAHRLLNRAKDGDKENSPNLWTPSSEANRLYQAISSSRSNNTYTALDDKTGELPADDEDRWVSSFEQESRP